MDKASFVVHCASKQPKDITPEEKVKRDAVIAKLNEAHSFAWENGYSIMICGHVGYYMIDKLAVEEKHTHTIVEEQYGIITEMRNGELITVFKPWPAKKV